MVRIFFRTTVRNRLRTTGVTDNLNSVKRYLPGLLLIIGFLLEAGFSRPEPRRMLEPGQTEHATNDDAPRAARRPVWRWFYKRSRNTAT